MRGPFCFSCVGVLDREGPTRNSAGPILNRAPGFLNH